MSQQDYQSLPPSPLADEQYGRGAGQGQSFGPRAQQTGQIVIPAVLGQVLGRLPAYPGSLLFTTALNLLLAKHLPEDVLSHLEGRRLRIEVLDAQLSFDYSWQQGAFRAQTAGGQGPDLVFKANAWVYWRMIQRQEDPDTLFFSRALQIEGDTELGLMVKNSLDALDLSVLQPKRTA